MNVSLWILVVPGLILTCVVVSLIRKKKPYDDFLEGMKEGLPLIKEIFPSLMAMLIAVVALRESGIIEDLGKWLNNLIPKANYFVELIPMVVFRPISGNASISIVHDVCSVHGPDSLLCQTVSAIQGSTDTTLYVLALYFGTIGVKKWRHTLAAGLFADAIGIIVAITLSLLFFT